jgi:hypothetical protein
MTSTLKPTLQEGSFNDGFVLTGTFSKNLFLNLFKA